MTAAKLRNGDYVPDGVGGFATASGAEAVLERVCFLLTARRGKFPLLPEVGSRLYQIFREKPSARGALGASYAAEALAGGAGLAGAGGGLGRGVAEFDGLRGLGRRESGRDPGRQRPCGRDLSSEEEGARA